MHRPGTTRIPASRYPSRMVLALGLLSLLIQGATAQTTTPSEPPRFAISGFHVEGNTLLPMEQVTQAVARYIGREKTFSDVQLALDALETAYRDEGYSAVQVILPEQVLEEGTVRLQVVEMKLGKVAVSGNLHFSQDNIRAALPALREGSSPNAKRISQNLQIGNENPAKQLQVVLKASETEGEVDAAVSVTDEKPWRLFATLDNTGTERTGRYRLGLGLQHANLFDRDHVLTANYVTSPDHRSDKVMIVGVGYRIPLYRYASTIDLIAAHSDVDSGTVGALSISGGGDIFGARFTRNLDRIGAYDHKLGVGLDYRAYSNQIQVLGGGASGFNLPDYTVAPISINYSGDWSLPSAKAGLTLSWSRNLTYADGGDRQTLQAVRFGARPDYTVLRLGLNYARQFDNDWQTRLAFSAQSSRDALVPGEQFRVGGAGSVRGFEESEVANDVGHRSSIEVYAPDLARLAKWDGVNLRPLAFIDLGYVRRNKPLANDPVLREHIGSVGVGLRLVVGKGLSVGVDYARVRDGGGNQNRGDDKFHANVLFSY